MSTSNLLNHGYDVDEDDQDFDTGHLDQDAEGEPDDEAPPAGGQPDDDDEEDDEEDDEDDDEDDEDDDLVCYRKPYSGAPLIGFSLSEPLSPGKIR